MLNVMGIAYGMILKMFYEKIMNEVREWLTPMSENKILMSRMEIMLDTLTSLGEDFE